MRIVITEKEKFKKDLGTDLADVISLAVGGIWNELVDSTPVKTGNARASWQVVKEGDDGTILPYGPRYPRPTLTIPTVKFNDYKIEIINTAAHLHELNYGNLSRPPTLFVEAALERGVKRAI